MLLFVALLKVFPSRLVRLFFQIEADVGADDPLSGELIQHKVNVVGQGPMVNLVGAVVKGLERLSVEQTHQKIKGTVIIRDHGIEGAFLFPQGVQVHVVPVCDRLDLGQVERCQPDGGGHEDRL